MARLTKRSPGGSTGVVSTARRREAVPLFSSGHAGPCRPSATTFTLLAVSFYLIATTLPVTVCYVLYLRFQEGDPAVPAGQRAADAAWSSHYTYHDVRTVVEELGMSHYACNFYIYLATGRCFRRELRRLVAKLVPCCRHLSHSDWTSQAESVASTSRL